MSNAKPDTNYKVNTIKKLVFFFAGILYLVSGIPPSPRLRWAGIVQNCYATEIYFFETKWGSSGSGDGQFNYAYDVAVDTSGNVYVADTENSRIQKFTSNGIFLTKWGSLGSGDEQFENPWSVAADTSGNVYIGETSNFFLQLWI